MNHNVLEGWLALAAETRRVDRLSSSLGLDSPALRNSPSSLGSSCGSPGLNTPSQNAFRFLPVLHEFAPELLKTPPHHQANASYPSSLTQSSGIKKTPLQEINPRRSQSDRARSSSDFARSSGVAEVAGTRVAPHQWRSQEQPNQYHPAVQNQAPIPTRPSMQNNRHLTYPSYSSHPSYPDHSHYPTPPTYPAWPPANPAPSYNDEHHFYHYDHSTTNGDIELDTEGEGEDSSTVTTLTSPFSPRDSSRDQTVFGNAAYARHTPYIQHSNLDSNMRYVRVGGSDSISPMLSEPFHRLIVKDENEAMQLSDYPKARLSSLRDMPNMSHPSEFSSLRDGSRMRTLIEEGEANRGASDWWPDDPFQRDLTFDLEMPASATMPIPVPASSMPTYQS